jgi:iron-sulfur cluster insertion protein
MDRDMTIEETAGSAMGTGMSISPSAARRIAELRSAEDNPNLMLRVSVSGGGCSGFQYGFAFDDTVNDDDQVFERDGVRIVVDSVSLDFLRGAELDYVEELLGSYFAVQNPNASSSCGCGTSFSL